ncbi:uracil-DNA glycosylase [Aerococcus sp. Group 2]|uniref:uracil-DNA glycosylase n=1 Tax=Aerococcus sp. Group 2 TaxID=2976811 RepID=UPI0018A7AE9A|nr:uracil-DNA glycosylase [Aerococcus sp. Group 2]
MHTIINNQWQEALDPVFESPAYQKLREFLKDEYRNQVIYPDMWHIYEAFKLTPFDQVKVVILGQDPYHEPHQAHGLSFSIQKGVAIPPSLNNIYQELSTDVGFQPVHHGNLTEWAEQGVLLLNSVLTVRQGKAHSHRGRGWEEVTDFAIQQLNKRNQRVVFILWGNAAKSKRRFIDENKHAVLTSVHPSPLSAYRGFFGSRPFSKANQLLIESGQSPINWQLSE